MTCGRVLENKKLNQLLAPGAVLCISVFGYLISSVLYSTGTYSLSFIDFFFVLIILHLSGNNRARFQSGRGFGYRNDGVRGRGNYGGGRGYGRGDFEGRTEYKGGNRSWSSNRGGGDGYQRTDNTGGNAARPNRGGGMPNGTAKHTTAWVSAAPEI